jgi:signal peptide peptidase SppA
MSPALRFLSAQHWAIIPGVFDSLIRIVENHDAGIRATPEQIREAQGHRAAFGMEDMGSAGEPVMQIRGDTAIIPVRGVLARYSDQINGACQDQGRSAESIQADLAKAAGNPNISRIILRIDSPGGSVAGTAETGAAIRAASESGKQVIAFVDGLAASAGYWLASQADQVIASAPGSLVGSIGVIMALVDASKNQEKAGYKVHVVRSVGLKAPGTANEALSSEQLASVQKVVADLHQLFADAVASGRGMDQSQMDQAATGEVFTATEGIRIGLVDSIASWESVVSSMDRTKKPKGSISTTATVVEGSATLLSNNPTGEDVMSLIKQAKAIADAHPAQAALVWEMAASDHTEEQILAAVNAKEVEAKSAADAAELARLKAEIEEMRAKVIAADTAKAAAELAAIEAKAKADALEAHAKGGQAGNTIKSDAGEATVKKISRDEFNSNQAAYVADIRKGLVVVAD